MRQLLLAGLLLLSQAPGCLGADSADIQAMINASSGAATITLDPAVTYTITAPIVITRSGVTIDGRGAVLLKDFHGASGADPTLRPAFYAHASAQIRDVVFRNLIFRNIGVAEGSPSDHGYYAQLNGVPVTYSRRHNKHINNDPAITVGNATDVLVEHCRAEDVGRFVATSGTSAGRVVVRENRILGWGHVAVSVGSESLIEGNVFDNTPAPIYNLTDRDGLDVGTSHAVYVYNGHDSVIVAHNVFRGVRNNAVKFDTGGSDFFERILVAGNIFDACTWTVYVGRLASAAHQVQVVGNHFQRSGHATVFAPDAAVTWQSNTHHGSGTARSDAGTAQLIGAAYKRLHVQGNIFEDPGPCVNCGGSSAENSAVAVYSTSAVSLTTVLGNVFAPEYVQSLYVTETHAGQTIRATANEFYSPVYVRYVEDGGQITFSGNLFDSTRSVGSVVSLYSEYRQVLVSGNTFVVRDNCTAVIPDDQGTTGWASILANVFVGAQYGTGINGVVTGPATLYVAGNTYLRATDANMEGRLR